MAFLFNPLEALAVFVEAFVVDTIDWFRGPTPPTSAFGFRCLACGHDMTDTDDTVCSDCGDPNALDQEVYPREMRQLAVKVPNKPYEGFALEDAYQAELARRKRRQSEYSREKLIGSIAVTKSALTPVGEIEIDGETHAATAENSVIGPGTQVLVVGLKGTVLSVRVHSARA